MAAPSGGMEVVYSNRTEQLVEELAEDLDRRDAFGDLFESPTVLVPNWNLARYLTFQLAQRFGVSGNFFSTVEEFLEDVAGDEVEFLDDCRLQAAILDRLRNQDLMDDEAMDRVVRYLELEDEDPGTDTARNVKRYQLARQLAGSFRQYAHSRVRMIQHWQQGKDSYTEADNYRSHEAWQRRLWLRLFDEQGRLVDDTEDDLVLLPEYYRRVDVSTLDLPERIHIFGVSHFAPVYGPIFENLARETTLRFYVVNPCREFWEDVIYDEDEESLEQLRARREQAPVPEDGLDLDPEQPVESPFALKAWGRAGRDLTHMLNELSGYQFRERWASPADGDNVSLLERFQQDVLDFEQPEVSPHPERWQEDETVRFLACRNKRREVEAIADKIWYLVEKDDLSFKDIAVVVNPRKREEYQSRIETVFEQVRDIPYNEIDFTQGDRSRMMDLLQGLLELPTEPIQRENVLTALIHPNFQGSNEELDEDQVKRWVDRLGIFHGGDHSDHKNSYLAEESDLFNWDQGIRRLVLGYFMDADDEEQLRFRDGENHYRPESLRESDVETAVGLVEGVRRLIATARSIQEERRSLAEWFEWMADYVRANVEPVEPGEDSEYHRYLDKLSRLANLEVGPGAIDYESAVRFALDELESMDYRPGDYLASGVVVSSFKPQRPIPFEAVFMLGMTEEDFPASSPRSPVDLQTESWQQGDLWDRDRERYMFLETLLCVRDRVYLSWVAKDPVTGEAVEPSSVIREFQRILEDYLGQDGAEELITRHHLRRFHPAYFDGEPVSSLAEGTDAEQPGKPATGPTYNPEAIAEARARRLRNEVLDREDWIPGKELSVRDLPGDMVDLLRQVEPPAEEDREDPDREETPERLKFRALEKFFKSPLQAWGKYSLGLDEEDEETIVDQNEEPFESNNLWRTVVTRDTMESAALRAGGVPREPELGELYRQKTNRQQERGHVPAGLFGSVQGTQDEDLLTEWRQALEEDEPEELTRVRFGSAGTVPNVRTETPIMLELPLAGEPRTVDLYGDTELFDPGNQTVYTFAVSDKPYKYLRGYLTGVALLTAERDEFTEDWFQLVLVSDEGKESREFTPGPPEEARELMKSWVNALLNEPHDYRLPFDVAKKFLADGTQAFDQRVREQDLGSDQYGGTRDDYGPLQPVESYPVYGQDHENPDQAVQEVLQRRLKSFWEGYFEEPWDAIVSGEDS